jgi:hypothetical protein
VLDLIQGHDVRRVIDAAFPCSSQLCHFQIPLDPGSTLDDNCFLNRPGGWRHLPSPVEQKSPLGTGLKTSAPTTTASVSYVLQARLFRGETLLASHRQKIYVFDCSEIAPPLVVEDFTPEYILRSKFVGNDENIAQCYIVHSPGASWRQRARRLRGIHQLEATVFDFCLYDMPEATPTTRQVTMSPSMAHIVKAGSNHHLKMRWSNWVRIDSSNSEYAEWSASYPIWLCMERSSKLPPTFSLPYLSRRYSILFEASISDPCRSRVALKLPVQIAYQSKEALSPSTRDLSPSCVHESALAGSTPLRNHDRQEPPRYTI